MKQATLLFLRENDQILLAMKKRGFGADRWNGVGGKPNEGEPIRETAIRECMEEIEVKPEDMTEVATLNFFFYEDKQEWDQQVIVYICTSWTGIPNETEEMAPKWFSIKDIPYAQMWSDDIHWLPKVLAGEYVNADFNFDKSENLLDFKVETIASRSR